MPKPSPRSRVRVELDVSPRDFVMARLAAARASAQASIDAIDECISVFVNPEDDKKAKERTELVDAALESMGCATRALESAEEFFDQIDPTEGEPWDEEEPEDDDEEEDDED
jgi:predicted ATP-grasp superfamily ATP-dependent carboligase